MSTRRLEGQVAWVTGAGSGIGKGIALRFAAEGARVAVVELDAKAAKQTVREITSKGGKAIAIPCDVSREKAVAASIQKTVSHFGGLQILVNNAGIVHVKQLHEHTEKEWDQLMAVNVKSIFFSVKHGFTHLRKNKRSYVVNIGSISSFVGQGSTPAYTTSKGAVLMLSKSIALDYAQYNLRCNCICPGITDTPLFRYHVNKTPDPAATLRKRLARVPLGIALTPDDIARAAVYFACEDSVGVTGASLIVDAGYLACAEWG
jgi:NAD(P)-dependent dehydrogenase (short-subunit alcohol dehydrogenase family)